MCPGRIAFVPGPEISISPGASPVPDLPPREIIFKHHVSLIASFREIWHSREVLASLVERSIRSRYKQASLGFAWAIISPLALMLAFTVFFNHVGKVDTRGVPYQTFSYVGLAVWSFFAGAVSAGTTSILNNVPLLNKIFCPRELFPLSSLFTNLFDTAISVLALIGLFVIFGFSFHLTLLWLPLLCLLVFAFTAGWTLILAALVVYVRDLRYALPLMLQVGLFITPVAYAFAVIPREWRGVYSLVNPLGPLIDAIRATMFYGEAPDLSQLGLAAVGTSFAFLFGYWFKRMETGIADLA
jgi:ABC-type polysaccharide/polyol phosphate export permease